MSVVGFDLGHQGCYVAVARHGGVEVVANEYSDRRSPSLVAFGPKRRLMGHSAKNQHIQNYKNTIYGFRHLLGRKFSDPYVQQEMKFLPFSIIAQKNDAIGIKISNDEGEKIFSPKQVTAMMLTYLKKVAEKALGKPVADCVISVPSFFTDAQRRALLDASAIAGLNCLRLFNDTTAAALAYGIYKQDLPAENEKPRNVAFVDVGYSSFQVAICSFQKGKLNVISKASDPNLGGRNLDFNLVVYFAEEFKKKYKISVKEHPKRFLRLMGEVEKVKKTMSTVTTPVPLNIECFADDRDVNTSIKREVFVDLCSELIDRVKRTLENALSKSKLALGDIDAVEILGGSCRVPAIKEAIGSVFKSDLSTTLNLDEAVCRGCALQCAMLSPTFRVRDFSVTDIQPYPIQLKWLAPMEGEKGEMLVYKEGDPIYHSKMLTFYRREPFDLEAIYAPSKELPFPQTHIGTYTIKNISPTDEGEASKIKIKVRVNIHGVFYVKDATMVEKQKQVEVPEPMETEPLETDVPLPDVDKMVGGGLPDVDKMAGGGLPDVDKMAGGDGSGGGGGGGDAGTESVPEGEMATAKAGEGLGGSEGSGGKTEQGQETLDGATKETSSGDNTSSADDDSPKTEKKVDSTPKPPETKKAKKPTIKYIDLPIVSLTPSMSRSELDGAHEMEVNLNYQDQLEQEKADARNAVEEYVYNMREKLYELGEYISEEDKAAFSDQLSTTEDWLYNEGEEQSKKVYVERLVGLRKIGDPVIQREKEFHKRPAAFNELGAAIVHFEKILESYEQGVELYNHIDQAEMDKVKEQVSTKRAWYETQMQACQATPKHVTALVTCTEVGAEVKNLTSACEPIVTKPKPKVEPPKDDQAEAKETEGKEADAAAPATTGEEAEMEEEPKTSDTTNPTTAGSEDMDLD